MSDGTKTDKSLAFPTGITPSSAIDDVPASAIQKTCERPAIQKLRKILDDSRAATAAAQSEPKVPQMNSAPRRTALDKLAQKLEKSEKLQAAIKKLKSETRIASAMNSLRAGPSAQPIQKSMPTAQTHASYDASQANKPKPAPAGSVQKPSEDRANSFGSALAGDFQPKGPVTSGLELAPRAKLRKRLEKSRMAKAENMPMPAWAQSLVDKKKAAPAVPAAPPKPADKK